MELYSVDGAGQTINNSSLHLLRWTNGYSYPTNSTAISLNGLRIGSDHFLVICVPLAANYTFSGYPSNTCDITVPTDGPADSNGDDQIAIIKAISFNKTNGGSFIILDIYGVPGQIGSITNGHFFQGGRAARLAGHLMPNALWNVSDWSSVYGNYGTKDMTPRSWSSLIISSSAIPTQRPTVRLAEFVTPRTHPLK